MTSASSSAVTVRIAVNCLFTTVTLVVAIVALINALMIGRDNLSLQKDLAECKSELKTSILKIKHNCERVKSED